MLEKILKKSTLLDVLIVFIGSIAIIGIWRGTWNLYDKYILSNNFILSQIITIIGGVIILVILAKIRN